MPLYYIATATFNPTTHRFHSGYALNWQDYISCSGFRHVREIVTLDGMLGGEVLERDNRADADFLVWENYLPGTCFHDLNYLLRKLDGRDPATYNLLAILREPDQSVSGVPVPGFAFVGYDLMDQEGGNSVLTNCLPPFEAIVPDDLNEYGLLSDFEQARQVQSDLWRLYPDDPHAKNCLMWAIWRMPHPNAPI